MKVLELLVQKCFRKPEYSPLRKVEDKNNCLELFIENNKYDSLRTVISFEKSPYKMYYINNHHLIPLFNEINGIKEPYNVGRQMLPQTYMHNGYIDILKTEILKKNTITVKMYAYLIKKEDNTDTLKDWEKAKIK